MGLFGKAAEWLLEKMADKIKDEAFDGLAKPIKDFLKKGTDKRKDYEFLKKAITEAYNETEQHFGPEEIVTLTNFFSDPQQQDDINSLVALAILDNNKNSFPFLQPILNFNSDTNRPVQVYFIRRLREKLAKHDLFSKILECIDRYNTIEVLKSLDERMHDISDTLNDIHIEKKLDQGIMSDGEICLHDYLQTIIDKHSFIDVPLVHDGMTVLPKIRLKDIFIPLDIKKTKASKPGTTTKEDPVQQKTGNKLNSEDQIVRHILTGYSDVRSDRTGLESLVQEKGNVVIIGTPGKGKTTLFRRAVLYYAESLLSQRETNSVALFPVFFRLRNFSIYLSQNQGKYPDPTHKVILDYLEYAYRVEGGMLTRNFFDHYLSQGNCIILMDGLDEVTENKEDVAQNLIKFINKYGNTETLKLNAVPNKIVISSRPKGYDMIKPFLSGGGLVEHEIQSLNRDEIHSLIRKLFSALDTNEAKNKENTEKLFSIITESDNSEDLLKIATNPLFCTALLLLYKWNSLELPQRTIDVFHEIINLLLGFWRSQQSDIKDAKRLIVSVQDKNYDVMSVVSRKWLRLSHLAWQMQLSPDVAVVTLEDAIKFLGSHIMEYDGVSQQQVREVAKEFLNHAHEYSGILVENEPQKFSFMHEQFREYFAASYMVALDDKDYSENILERIFETSSSWQEILIMAMSHKSITPPRRIGILDKLVETANAERDNKHMDKWARCLFFAGKVSSDSSPLLPENYKRKVRNILFDTTQDLTASPNVRHEAGLVLDRINWLPAGLHDFVEIAGVNNTPVWIGKYPVTNIQYKRFIKSIDYGNADHWKNQTCFSAKQQNKIHLEHDGLDWLELQAVNILPKFWDNEKFGIYYKTLPVVGISWYEANAYCHWLLKNWQFLAESRECSVPKNVRLPTATEWLLAADGFGGNKKYPWQPGANSRTECDIQAMCNLASPSNRPSVVGIYGEGMSQPHGIHEMLGNVWEWQANYFDHGHTSMALKGGSFKSKTDEVTLSAVGTACPDGREEDIGFRVLLEF